MIAAFKKFHADHSDAFLVHNWFNPQAILAGDQQDLAYRTLCDSKESVLDKCLNIIVEQTMSSGKIVKAQFPIEEMLEENGISIDDSFKIGPRMNTTNIAELYRRVDAAVFPYAFRFVDAYTNLTRSLLTPRLLKCNPQRANAINGIWRSSHPLENNRSFGRPPTWLPNHGTEG
jgi:hypothetical protein